MEPLSTDLAATYLNVLVVLLLTLVVENKFDSYVPGPSVRSLVRASQIIAVIDVVVLTALLGALRSESSWVVGAAAWLAIALTAGIVIGMFVGNMQHVYRDSAPSSPK